MSAAVQRLPLAEAAWLAGEIVAWLAPGCERIAVAGSVRRERPDVKDLEVVGVPAYEEHRDLLGETIDRESQVDLLLREHLARGHLALHPVRPAWGERYKRLWVPSHAMQLDLFLADADNYGYILALRTGDADFSRALVTKRSAGGLMPRGHFHHDGYLRHLERGVVPAPSEEDYFRCLGLPVVPPPERNAAMARRLGSVA